jgi:hypothetical protein
MDKTWESNGGKVAYSSFLWATEFHNLCAQIRRSDSTKVLLVAFPVACILELINAISEVTQEPTSSKQDNIQFMNQLMLIMSIIFRQVGDCTP